ncbi:MAG TPA: GNAT family N-acetyltransferase [Acidimicrobiales bacterium]|nr:GNAT family N-acetyltransferase [Acidimicrobiales bacterium]
MTLSFRTAGPDDVAAVVALVEAAYRGADSRRGWTTEADLLEGQRTDAEQVRDLLARPESEVVLAERDGRLVACFHIEVQRHLARSAYFGMFAVDPGLQGGGVGRAMIAEARRRATGWDCQVIRMTVIRQRTDLIAWYERLGFRPTGETEPFPYGDERFGRPVRADLEFVVLSGGVETDG